jgi:chromosome segregation ATPase
MSDYIIYDSELNHFGVLGMKWGIRRYQNADGTLTAAGKKRVTGYTKKLSSLNQKLDKTEARKQKVTDRYNKHAVANARRDVKVNIYKQKRNRLQPKVSKITTKMLVKGKSPNFFEKRTLKKAYKLDKRIANASRSKIRFEKQISKLDFKEARIQRRINRYNRKLSALQQSDIETGRSAVAAMLED